MPTGYWEHEHLLQTADITVIGSGIVGMSAALHLRRLKPDACIRILERHPLSAGGTTRNAGFACFGSAGEWMEDLDTLGREALVELVRTRAAGLRQLIGLLGEDGLGLEWSGSWELHAEAASARRSLDGLDALNAWVTPVLNEVLGDLIPTRRGEPALVPDPQRAKECGAAVAIRQPWEGLLHTGRMVESFHRALDAAGIQRLHGITVLGWEPTSDGWRIDTQLGPIGSRQLAICANGFAKAWLPELDVRPVPNRVLVFRPESERLPKGAYHLERGYLYMRTLPGGHVLFGGGRHWGHDLPLEGHPETEARWDAQLLEEARRWLGRDVVPTHRWTGWLGVGDVRAPLIGSTAPGLFHAVRMGGMGVAIGAGVGAHLADLIHKE